MFFYKVRPEYDQMPRFKHSTFASKRVRDGIFIANELYTLRELNKFYVPEAEAHKMFDLMYISKNKVYKCFGARFEMEGD